MCSVGGPPGTWLGTTGLEHLDIYIRTSEQKNRGILEGLIIIQKSCNNYWT